MNKLTVNNLTKYFGKNGKVRNIALENASGAWEEGKVHAIIGKNGAGKSTLLRLIGNLSKPSSGEIFIPPTNGPLGFKRKSKVALLSPNSGLHDQLTIKENIKSFHKICRNHDNTINVSDLMHRLGLDKYKNHRPTEISTGILQRARIAQIISLDPKVILLDEPTSGLDIQGKSEFYSLISELKSKNKIILISTHDISEITTICQTTSIISQGKIIQNQALEHDSSDPDHIEETYAKLTQIMQEKSNV